MKLLPCTQYTLLFNVVYCTFCSIFLLVILHFVATLFRFAQKHNGTKTDGKCSCAIMITFCFLTIASRALFVFHEDGCYGWSSDGAQVTLLRMVYMTCFTVQSVALCYIFFTKLVFIFDGSPYEISRCTKSVFAVIFVLYPVFIVLALTTAWSLEKYFAIAFMLWVGDLHSISSDVITDNSTI